MLQRKIVIADDSSLSTAFIKDILEKKGYEVVGTAKTLREIKEVVSKTKPYLITTDLAFPDTDGFKTIQAIREIDDSIKIIILSSMMDDLLIKNAKAGKVSAYIQKPIDGDELIAAIESIVAYDELYMELDNQYFPVFKGALLDGFARMTKTSLTYKGEFINDKGWVSEGITVVIDIIGKFYGRIILDFSEQTAKRIAASILKREPGSINETIAVLEEFVNIISVNTCSILNKRNNYFDLRVTQPNTIHGGGVIISAPDFSMISAMAGSDFGEILLSAGFQKES